MCGLAAIVDFVGAPGLVDALLAMHEPIAHRGPDGEGFCVVDDSWRSLAAGDANVLRDRSSARVLRAGLAFRWLKIQDGSAAAAQPMASQDGSTLLLFNGEIYNFRELRGELESLGYSFRSHSDTEVILAAYRHWGKEAFRRLDGMWAIVIVDLRSRTLLLSRDRFGIKPLFYHLGGSRLVVASEVKQLLAAGVAPAANMSAVTRFIRGSRPESPEQTFFQAIVALPAATYAEVDLQKPGGELNFTAYWRLAPSADAPVAPSLENACTRLDGLLTQSVADHMVGPVPMGILVSGGLDSSIVAARAVAPFAGRGERGMGFSMVLDRSHAPYDETRHIEQVVSAFGLHGFTVELTPEWLKSNIARITRAQEEPVAGIAAAGQFLAFELAATHKAKVVLDGQGADELFAGYPRHQFVYLRDCARRLAIGALLGEIVALARRDRRFFRDLWKTTIARRLGRLVRGARARSIDFIQDEGANTSNPANAPGRE